MNDVEKLLVCGAASLVLHAVIWAALLLLPELDELVRPPKVAVSVVTPPPPEPEKPREPEKEPPKPKEVEAPRHQVGRQRSRPDGQAER